MERGQAQVVAEESLLESHTQFEATLGEFTQKAEYLSNALDKEEAQRRLAEDQVIHCSNVT